MFSADISYHFSCYTQFRITRRDHINQVSLHGFENHLLISLKKHGFDYFAKLTGKHLCKSFFLIKFHAKGLKNDSVKDTPVIFEKKKE